MRGISLAAALAGIAFSAQCVAIATDNWPTNQGNISRNGYTARALRADLVAPAWRVTLSQTIVFGLAIYKGVVFTSSSHFDPTAPTGPFDVHLTARRVSDGQTLWDADLGLAEAYTAIHVDNDTAYVATFNPNTVYAYATNGTLRWSKSFAGSTQTGSRGPLAVNGAVYLFDATNAHAYAAADGASLWDQPLATVSNGGSAPTWWNGMLLRHTPSRLDIIDAATGQNVGGVGPGASTGTANTVTVFGNTAYLLDGNALTARDLTNPAALLWPAYSAPSPVTPVANASDVVISGLKAIDRQFGVPSWQTSQSWGGSNGFADMLLTDTHIIAFAPGNMLSLVSWQTHISDADLPVGGAPNTAAAPIAYGADTLVVGTLGGAGYLDAFTLPTDDIFVSPFE